MDTKKIVKLLSRIIIIFIAVIVIYRLFIENKYSSPILSPITLLLGFLTINNSNLSKKVTEKIEIINIINLCYIFLLLILINFVLK